MSNTQTNGDMPSSKVVSHITNYPLSSDIINIYQSNPLGAKSINLFNQLYAAFSDRFLPYLQTPISIVAPYLEKADHLGDSALNNVDERFPAIKKTDIDTLKGHAATAASYPLHYAIGGKDYLLSTYDSEYQKMGANGLVSHGKAIVSTEFRVLADTVNKFSEWMGPKSDEAKAELEKMKKLGSEKYSKLQKSAKDAKGQAEAKTDEVVNGQ